MITYSTIKKSQLEGALRMDAEYYQPEYLDMAKRMLTMEGKPLVEHLSILYRYPTFFNLNYYDNGILVLKGEDILMDGFIQNKNKDFISLEDAKNFPKTKLAEGDIIFSVRGLVGKIGFVDKKYENSIISANLIRAKVKNISPYFLWVFLNCKYGVGQVDRFKMITAQETILADDIKNILVPEIFKAGQNKIEEIAKKSINFFRKSETLYEQVKSLLLKELELKDFEEDKSLFSVVNLSEVENANRMDAEYFQEKYKKLVKKIKLNNAKKLGNLVSIKKGFEPGSEEYYEEGKLFIRVSSLSVNGIENSDQKYLSEKLYQELKKDYEPKVGEILLTKDATPGIAYVIEDEIKGIISSGILRLMIKEKVDVEYLALCINSLVGQWQAERDAGGSVIAHWKPEQIKKLLIPILPKPTQQKIADLVLKAHEARKKAKELLEEAKKKVEEMIENKK